MKAFLIAGFLFLSIFIKVNAQYFPVLVNEPVFFGKTSPLRNMKIIPPKESGDENDEVFEIMTSPFSNNKVEKMENYCVDPFLQKQMGEKERSNILVNTEGVGNLQNKIPPDTEGDVGTDHYLQMVNMSFSIFDKQGNLIFGPAANLTIWQEAPGIWSEYSNGDPIVLYDESANRWLISELSFPYHPNGPYYEKIAISESGDPTGSWYLYGYEYDYFCDYPKIGVWRDGYYMTTNNNYWDGTAWHFHAVGVSVLERDSMLVGSPNARRIFFDLYPNTEPWSVLPADFDGESPPEGAPAYLAYYKEAFPDRIGIFSVFTNWNSPATSEIQFSDTLYPEPFSGDLPNGIPQPEGAPYLASMSNRLLYRLQYRNFGSYQTLVTNHTVNNGNDVAAIRWYEFRNDGEGWQIFQQGTYSPDNTCRWMGSIAMDAYGNIALGYSVSDINTYPSIRFTGRYNDDPLGIMTIQEQEVIQGSGVQLNYNHRWGDYSSMSVDPVNNTDFWYTQEYYEITGNRTWQTRIAAFNLIDPLSLSLWADNDSICKGDSTQLFAQPTGGNENYSYSWISDPAGFTSTLQNPSVGPDTTTVFICTLSDGVNEDNDSLIVFVQYNPVVYAGADTMILAEDSYYIQDAWAEYFSALNWTSDGDGIFNNSNIPDPIYTPGSDDIFNGNVHLSLTAFPNTYCDTVSDTMLLTIQTEADISTKSKNKASAYVQPNPSDGNFNLILVNFKSEEVVFIIRQLSGEVIYKDSFIPAINETRNIRFDYPGPGIYLAQLKSRNHITSLKLVIL